MKKHLLSVIIIPAALLLISTSIMGQDVKEIFENEKAFCKTLTETGYSEAFLKFIDEEGIMFVPRAAQGKEYFARNKSDFKGLIWEADFAEISQGGDFAYSTGPWHSNRVNDKGEQTTTYGHFITVWHKVNGEWKFLIDCGINYEKDSIKTNTYTAAPVPTPVIKRNRFMYEEVMKADDEFNNLAANEGLSAAYEKFASENVRTYRAGLFPIWGKKPLLANAGNVKTFFVHGAGKAAVRGDFAFSYGEAGTSGDETTHNYLKVWKREAENWKIVIDYITPIKK